MNSNPNQKNTNISFEYNSLLYLLNMDEKSAQILGNNSAKGDVIIPYSIIHESIEYIVIEICENAFRQADKIESIQFSPNSKLKTIGKYAFCESSIQKVTFPLHLKKIEKYAFKSCLFLQLVEFPTNSELQIIETEAFSFSNIESIKLPPHLTKICENAFFSCDFLRKIEIPFDSELRIIEKGAFSFTSLEEIVIPSNLVELQDGWCEETQNLTRIRVSLENRYFKSYNDDFIIKKSNPESDNYEILAFAQRDIVNAQIPSFIKIIGPFAFSQCSVLEKVEFSNDSKLQIIEERSFSETSIKYIILPNSLQIIKDSAFTECKFLETISIQEDSELQTICRSAFFDTSITSLSIPSKLVDLKDCWCNRIPLLTNISISVKNPRYICSNKYVFGKSNLKNDDYDTLEFACRDIVIAKIPSFINKIASCAFRDCQLLQSIEFSADSKLKIIDYFAFFNSSIRYFSLPPSVKIIGISAFNSCFKLKKIDIQKNSQLQKIDAYSFMKTSITSFYFPPHLTQIAEDSFERCYSFQIIEVDENFAIESIDHFMLSFNSEVLVMIPEKINKRIWVF